MYPNDKLRSLWLVPLSSDPSMPISCCSDKPPVITRAHYYTLDDPVEYCEWCGLEYHSSQIRPGTCKTCGGPRRRLYAR